MIKIKIDREKEIYRLFLIYIKKMIGNENNYYCTVYCSKCNYKYNFNFYNISKIYEHAICYNCSNIIKFEYCNINQLYKKPHYGHPRVFYLLIKRVLKLQPNVRWMYIESHIKDD